MSYKPIFTDTAVIFNLKKPIYGSYFGIWDKWLDQAGDRWIVVNTPFGRATFKSASEYKSKAKRIKRYYKNPDVPMIFYAMEFLPEITDRTERKKMEKKYQVTRLPYEAKVRLAKIFKEKYLA